MRTKDMRIYERALAWIVALAATAYVIGVTWIQWRTLSQHATVLLALALPAMIASSLAQRVAPRSTPRFASVFVLAAMLLFPPPAGLLVAVAALTLGRGGGLIGLPSQGVASFGAAAVSIAIAEYFIEASDAAAGSLRMLGWALLVFVFAQGLAVGMGRLAGDDAGRESVFDIRVWRGLAMEIVVSVPLAWLLAEMWSRDARLQAAALSALALAGAASLVFLARALQALGHTRESLVSRVTELDTLHAIGREILSSLEPGRVFEIVDRECRKIFDVDLCVIALAEREGSALHAIYRRRRGSPARTTESPLDAELCAWVAEHKRGLRIDDSKNAATRAATPGVGFVDAECRSAIAAPLLVEGRVVGLLILESRRVAAFDDHGMSVLTTVAQQAAVAIENAKHYQMATVDSLTGFFLRDYYFRRLDEEYRRAKRYDGTFALLMLDLDDFKSINDEHGHFVGDQLLRRVGRTIRSALRAADLACRYGGDEFCLLLPETDLAGASIIAERIRAAIGSGVLEVEGLALRTTASIGIAVFPQHDVGAVSALVQRADEALYRAKRAGRDRVVPFAA